MNAPEERHTDPQVLVVVQTPPPVERMPEIESQGPVRRDPDEELPYIAPEIRKPKKEPELAKNVPEVEQKPELERANFVPPQNKKQPETEQKTIPGDSKKNSPEKKKNSLPELLRPDKPSSQAEPFKKRGKVGRKRKYEEIGIDGERPVKHIVLFYHSTGRHWPGMSEDMQEYYEYWYFTKPNRRKDGKDYERHVKAVERIERWFTE